MILVGQVAANQWIAGQTVFAEANRMMLFHFAESSVTTGAWARIAASEANARLVTGAFIVDAAFVAAAAGDARRIAAQTFWATTHALSVCRDDTLSAWSAWIGFAWRTGLFAASDIRIAKVTGTAEALFAII